jgi:hypothetical protein
MRLFAPCAANYPPCRRRHPNSVALAVDLTANDADGRFEFGLDLLIEGLERRAKH